MRKPGPQPYIFTRRNRMRIRAWVENGDAREDIAARLGTSVGSLSVMCSRLGIPLTNKEKREPHLYTLQLTARAHENVRQYAADLGWTEARLLSELIEVIHKDDLFEAVLDI